MESRVLLVVVSLQYSVVFLVKWKQLISSYKKSNHFSLFMITLEISKNLKLIQRKSLSKLVEQLLFVHNQVQSSHQQSEIILHSISHMIKKDMIRLLIFAVFSQILLSSKIMIWLKLVEEVLLYLVVKEQE